MQFKAVALLAVVSFGTSAVALPGANPQPSSTPAPKPQVPVYDTTGFTGELVADKDKGTCYVKLHLPGIDCDGETDHDDHRLAYEDGSCVGRSKDFDSGPEHGVYTYPNVCGSGELVVHYTGSKVFGQFYNSVKQHAYFTWDAEELENDGFTATAFKVSPGPGRL